MKVWVVLCNSGSCPSDHDVQLIGVFSTRERADEEAKRVTSPVNPRTHFGTSGEVQEVDIDEVVA